MFGAVRCYPLLVLAMTLLTGAVFVAVTLLVPEVYRATAAFTVPQQTGLQDQGDQQYLDSQVVILQSQEVAERAAAIANAALRRDVLAVDDFIGPGKASEITPPERANRGTFGAGTVTVSFTWSDARVAKDGANALVAAFDEARTASIQALGDATVASLQKLMDQVPQARDQLAALVDQRSKVLIKQQLDLAQHPTVAWATEPAVPLNANSTRIGGTGLMVGFILGVALAFAWARHRCGFTDPLRPTALYRTPLFGDIPRWARRGRRMDAPVQRLPVSTTADVRRDTTGRTPAAEAFRLAAGALRAAVTSPTSVVIVSPSAGPNQSVVAANIALALGEGGTRVLVVDADPGGELAELLVPGSGTEGGFSDVLAGRRALVDCMRLSPSDPAVMVLGYGSSEIERAHGVAYRAAFSVLLSEATANFDLVLVNGPSPLRDGDAGEPVGACDAVLICVSPDEPIREHLELARRLGLLGAEPDGYLYLRSPIRHRVRSPEPSPTDGAPSDLAVSAAPETAPATGISNGNGHATNGVAPRTPAPTPTSVGVPTVDDR